VSSVPLTLSALFADEQGRCIEAQDTDTQKDILHGKFANAGWECSKILAAMESCNVLYFDRVSQIRMDRWSQGRVGR
jgi:hypothetical protein